jgi:putative flavoprotein involved in K+ transport
MDRNPNGRSKHTGTVVIGGGHAGLAMSCCLTERGLDHVVLERGKVGERWRSERWDSLRLLTPNWQSRLPNWHYRGQDPDGYMTMPEFIAYLEGYASSFNAPVLTGTTVRSVERCGPDRFRVVTDRGTWTAANVVIATGHCDVPHVPAFSRDLADDIQQIVPSQYRNPQQIPDGGVLVVGASASGAQLAEELAEAGRRVTLAVGTHVRLPRQYRGKDILWWMEFMGGFRTPADPADDRKSPPPVLVGRPEHRSLDLDTLQCMGVRLAGHATEADGTVVRFMDDLHDTVTKADAGLQQLLAKIDEFITAMGMEGLAGPVESFRPVSAPRSPLAIDLKAENISTVIWATGFRRRYPWLHVPVLDEHGEIRHAGGVTPDPGLYVLGLRFQRSKGSNIIDGAGADAQVICRHLAERRRAAAA